MSSAAAALLVATLRNLGGGVRTVRPRGGFARVWAIPTAAPLLMVAGAVIFFVGMLNPSLLPLAYVVSPTKGPSIYTVLELCLIAGLLAGSGAAGRFGAQHRQHALAGSILLFGMAILAIGFSPTLALAVVAIALGGVGNSRRRPPSRAGAPRSVARNPRAPAGCTISAASPKGCCVMNHAPPRDDIGNDRPNPRLRVDTSREGSDATNLALPAGSAGALLEQRCRSAAAVTVVDWSYAPSQSSGDSAGHTSPGTRQGAPPTRRIAIIGGGKIARVCAGIEPILGAARRVEVVRSACSLEEVDDSGIHVDAVILDLQMEDGRRTTAVISAVASRYPVLVIAASGRRDDMLAVIRAGASGYLTSNASGDAIIEAVATIATGGFYLSAHLTDVIDTDTPPAASTAAQVALSRREKEALLCISRGLTHAQTANRMGVSSATIDTFVKRIRRKLGPANKADLTREAIRLGYLDPASLDQRASSERSSDVADVGGDDAA